MYSSPFEYVRASSWKDAVAQLQQGDEEARVISGGQSLVPMMMLRLATPSLLVDVAGAGERTIDVRDRKLVLSALVRHVDLEHSHAVQSNCPMLTEAVSHIGNVRVRQRGTIGGSLAHGEATAELATVAVAQQATVRVLGPSRERTIAASDLFVTHLTTSLQAGEVITAVEFPIAGERSGSCFTEITRRAGDFAMVEAAAALTLDDDGRCATARLVVGAVHDHPADVSDAAQALVGDRVGDEAVSALARSISEDVEIGPSTHAGLGYRREMVAVLIKRALRTAAARATSGSPPPQTNRHIR
jgi:CO/xanthine dehydrogenase FAD-binding subunit